MRESNFIQRIILIEQKSFKYTEGHSYFKVGLLYHRGILSQENNIVFLRFVRQSNDILKI